MQNNCLCLQHMTCHHDILFFTADQYESVAQLFRQVTESQATLVQIPQGAETFFHNLAILCVIKCLRLGSSQICSIDALHFHRQPQALSIPPSRFLPKFPASGFPPAIAHDQFFSLPLFKFSLPIPSLSLTCYPGETIAHSSCPRSPRAIMLIEASN